MSEKYNRYHVYTPRSVSLSPPQKIERRTPRKTIFLMVTFMIMAFWVHIGIIRVSNAKAEVAVTASQKAAAETIMAKSIAELVKNPRITFSVSVSGLAPDDRHYHFGTSEAMDAASTAKIITGALFLKEVEKGQLSLSSRLGGLSASYQLQQMVNQSDDQAWQIFNSLLGHRALNNYAGSLGLNSYDADTNTITSDDMSKFLELLYKGKLLDRQHTRLLLAYMKHTNYEELITPAVIRGATLFHKVGVNDDQVNDTAVINRGSSGCAITIFSNGHGTYDWPERAELMQKMAAIAQRTYLGLN